MDRRLTRAAARAAAGLPAQAQTIPIATQAPTTSSTTKKKTKDTKKLATTVVMEPDAGSQKPTPKANPARKRSKTSQKPLLKSTLSEELPHNLGAPSAALQTDVPISRSGSDKENQSVKEEIINSLATDLSPADAPTTTTIKVAAISPKKASRVKRNPYGLTPGQTPFPDWTRPTTEECEVVNQLLSEVHGEVVAPKTIPEPSLTVTGCGEVPSVLDALIRTLLSGATTGSNSAKAFNGLVQRFGILAEGIGKGSINWDAVRQASLKDVFEAIKSGGLADIKSKNLKAILDMVHEENQERRNLLVSNGSDVKDNAETKNEGPERTEKVEKDKKYEIACADQSFLSLNHLHNLSSEEAMTELVKYPGIGPKTAACVILFCLQRPCFAVDTHIFRICKWLGWVPPTRANEVTAFSHLEVRIPDHLKYSLHQLFIRHGKSCPRCRAITGESSAGWEEGCVIDHLVKRTGKRKGSVSGAVAARKGRAAGTKRKQNDSSDEESELSELSDLSDESSGQ